MRTWLVFKSNENRIWTSLLSLWWLGFRLEPVVWWNVKTATRLQISFEYIFQLHQSIFLDSILISFEQIYWRLKWIKVLIHSRIHILFKDSWYHSKLLISLNHAHKFFFMIEFRFSYKIRPNRQSEFVLSQKLWQIFRNNDIVMQSRITLYRWRDSIKIYHLLRIWTNFIRRYSLTFLICAWVFDNFIFYLCHFSDKFSHVHWSLCWMSIFNIENEFVVVLLAFWISRFRLNSLWLHQPRTKICWQILSILPIFHRWPVLAPINDMQWGILRQEVSVKLFNCYFWYRSLWHRK